MGGLRAFDVVETSDWDAKKVPLIGDREWLDRHFHFGGRRPVYKWIRGFAVRGQPKPNSILIVHFLYAGVLRANPWKSALAFLHWRIENPICIANLANGT